MKESTIEQKHRKIAMKAGWFVEKITATARNGFPDRFYASRRGCVCRTCGRGRVVLIEFKRPGGRIMPQQHLRMAQLRHAGVEVYVCRSVDEAEAVLRLRSNNDDD